MACWTPQVLGSGFLLLFFYIIYHLQKYNNYIDFLVCNNLF